MPTNNDQHRMYRFDRFIFDIDRGALIADGEVVKLRPKSFRVLQYLLERKGTLVSKGEILDEIWGSTVVTDDAVTQCLIDVRRALDDFDQKIIQTVPRRGYIIDIPVHTSADGLTTTQIGWHLTLVLTLAATFCIAVWWMYTQGDPDVENSLQQPDAGSYSVAVLPFLDLSPDSDLGYFAEGISEEIINLLTQVDRLRVIARTSSFSPQVRTADIAAIKDRLGVSHVLEGSVREFENAIRISVQLIDTQTNDHVWSATYDREFGRIFEIQDDIANDVHRELTSSMDGLSSKSLRTDAAAYRLYLQAVQVANQIDHSNMDVAESLIRQVLEIDPEYAPAWRELSRILWRKLGSSSFTEKDLAVFRNALETAYRLNPGDGATLAYLGFSALDLEGDLEKGARLFKQALALEPMSEHVIRTASQFTQAFGKREDAIRLSEFGVLHNPLCLRCYIHLFRAYENAGMYAAAHDTRRLINSIFDTDIGKEGLSLIIAGDPESALKRLPDVPTESERLRDSAMALYSLGRLDESELAMLQYIDRAELDPWGRAVAYAWTGRSDEAFAALEEAVDSYQVVVDGRKVRSNLIHVSSSLRSALYESLHDDPRWPALLEKYGISDAKVRALNFSVKLPNQDEDA